VAQPTVQVQGAREVRSTLRKLGAGTRDMTAVHRKVGAMVLGPAAGRSRRKSGDLAGSYKVRASAAKAAVASTLIYAGVQEWGWPRHGITPSLALSGTLEDMAPELARVYQRHVEDLVDRLNRTGGPGPL
jgi:hypothetical protein